MSDYIKKYKSDAWTLRNHSSQTRVAAKRLDFKRDRGRRRLGALAVAVVGVGLIVGFTSFNALGKKDSKPKVVAQKARQVSAAVKKPLGPRELVSVDGSALHLLEPAARENVRGIGFHEAENKLAKRMNPIGVFVADETTTSVTAAFKKHPTDPGAVRFLMYGRGRGSDPQSAMDIAVKNNVPILAPVNGVVSKIKEYYLYGKYFDYQIDITPDGCPDVRVVMIHVDKLKLVEGQRLKAGETVVGVVRNFGSLVTQINEYLPSISDHVHIQINPASSEGQIAQ